MAASIFIATEPRQHPAPLWTVLEDTRLRPLILDTVPNRRGQAGQPLWTVLEDTQLRPQTFETEPWLRKNPLWTELADSIRPQFESEPPPTQPFIDSLAPVTVGSAWRAATLEAAKINTTAALPVLYPQPSDVLAQTDGFLIPCGDRIPEFADALVGDPSYSPPAYPGLDDDRTIIMLDATVLYMDGSQQSGWTVVSTPNTIRGFDYALTPPSPTSLGTHTLSVYLEGVESFQAEIEFDVADTSPPVLQNTNPSDMDTGVAVDANVVLEIIDLGSGVDASTVVLTVDGATAWTGDAQQAGFVVTKLAITNGFRYTINPDVDFDEWKWIVVHVYAADNAPIPNILDQSYQFKTEDVTAPVLGGQNPFSGQIDVSRSANVVLELTDTGAGLDEASVVLTVEGAVAYSGGVEQPGFTVTKLAIADGFRYTINPDTNFGSYQTVDVGVYAEDLATIPNVLSTSYNFRTLDDVAPYLANQDPFPGQTGVSPVTNITLDVLDAGAGVAAATIVLRVNGTIAWQSDTQQPGFVVTKTVVAGGFHYVINPDSVLPLGTNTVRVVADDLATTPNTLDTSYTFEVVDVVPPTIDDTYPQGSDCSPDTLVSFTCEDDIQVVLSSIQTTIDGETAILNGVFQFGWNGSSSSITPNVNNGYDVVIQKETSFAYEEQVTVHVSIADLSALPVTEEWNFTVSEDPTCFTGPLNATEEALITPFTALPNCEKLRTYLFSYITTNHSIIEGARAIFLRGHSQELSPVLFNIVPVVTEKETASRLCHKATNISVANNLRRKTNVIPAAIRELVSLGLPSAHRTLFERYAQEDQPNTEVPLACVIVLLAKAFE